jgi:hypothetical protein
MESNHTFVTSFIDLNLLETRYEFKQTDIYIQNGLKLLSYPYNFIIFIDKISHETVCSLLSEDIKVRVKFIIIDITELPVYQEVKNVDLRMPSTCKPGKDTYNYMSLMISKTFFLKRAIEENFFNSVQFSWIDWGIIHIIRENVEEFEKGLEKINNSITDKIRIPGSRCPWYLKDIIIDIQDFMDYPVWLFCGGFFSGPKQLLLEFDNEMTRCIQILKENKFFTWEVNIWIYIFSTKYDLFDWYLADHNCTMISYY